MVRVLYVAATRGPLPISAVTPTASVCTSAAPNHLENFLLRYVCVSSSHKKGTLPSQSGTTPGAEAPLLVIAYRHLSLLRLPMYTGCRIVGAFTTWTFGTLIPCTSPSGAG